KHRAKYSPPRRGGEAAPPRKCREATEAAQTGWSDLHPLDFRRTDHPGAARHPSSARRGMTVITKHNTRLCRVGGWYGNFSIDSDFHRSFVGARSTLGNI